MVLVFGLAASQAGKSYRAERFDVTVEVMEGGSLSVVESVVFDFQGGPFTFVFRELPTDFTDGVVDIVASVDGRVLPEGAGPGQVEIERANPIRVTWHMEPISDTAREFELAYTMLGVIRREQNADLLWWQALPVEHEYTIVRSAVVVAYPPAWPLANEPSVVEGQATVALEPGHVRFGSGVLLANESMLISVPFRSGAVLEGPPAWQAQRQAAATQRALEKTQQDGRAWIWFALGGLVLVGGSVLLFRAVRSYRRTEEKRPGLAYDPPSDLPPAMAGALRGDSAAVAWQQALGTLFDLAGRGCVTIEQLPKRRWMGHDFLIRREAGPNRLRPHEISLMELLLGDRKGRIKDAVKVSSLSKMVTSKRWKGYTESVEEEMAAAGLVDPTRKKARGRIMSLALVPMALILAVAVILILLHGAFGWWPLVLAGALLIMAILWLIGGAGISVLSDDGARLAADWQPFYRYLKDVSRGKAAPANEDEFETYLPYAAAFGLVHAWAKRFEKRGWKETPAYFRPLSGAGQTSMVAFVAMTAATSSSGGAASTSAAGAGAAGGAAGGGASGAG
jgi:hypothetical protein